MTRPQLRILAKKPGIIGAIRSLIVESVEQNNPYDAQHFVREQGKLDRDRFAAISACNDMQNDHQWEKKYLRKEIYSLNQLIKQIDALQNHSGDTMNTEIYVPLGVDPKQPYGWENLAHILAPEQQQKARAAAGVQAVIDDARERAETIQLAKPNELLIGQIMEIASQTMTGRYIISDQSTRNERFLFHDIEEGRSPSNAAFHYTVDGKNRFNIGRMNDIEELAHHAVHEERHAHQNRNFPELFQSASPADQFVAVKLTEADAWTSGIIHKIERHGQIHGATAAEPNTYSEHYAAKFIEVLENLPWDGYEKPFTALDIGPIIESGEFQQAVHESRFLKPDFLERFCVAPDGTSFFPTGPKARQTFMETIHREIATFYNPILIAHADKATETAKITTETPRPPQAKFPPPASPKASL